MFSFKESQEFIPAGNIQFPIDIVDVIRTAINVKNILSKESIECASDIVDEIGYDAKILEEVAYNMHKKYYKKYT